MIRLFLSGDVMTGRGVDQVFAQSCSPRLHEPWVKDAREYVHLAEQQSGPIPKPVDHADIWGVALDELERRRPDARIVNLETSVTTSEDYRHDKDIHYRMHPANVACLRAAQLDCCVVANNHVLDWGYAGLDETLDTLATAGLAYAGAGHNEQEAAAPVIVDMGARGRVLVYAYGDISSGIPPNWRAHGDKAGINLLDDTSPGTARYIAAGISQQRRPGDVVVVSIHWGPNWGYAVSREHREFAHELIDSGVVDVLHGHSSHHPKGIEIYNDRPIFYGCGDLITDYEGIAGHEEYRGSLSLLYFVDVDPVSERVLQIEMVPMRLERFRLWHASVADAEWLQSMFDREGREFRTSVRREVDKTLKLQW
jgi:poly-gamma-glutamate synthesis protein (capsule biosynthesis protein)